MVARLKGFTVAIIGPDGAGKTTVCRRLIAVSPRRLQYLYMGVNPNSADSLLPTTRFVRAVRRYGLRRGTTLHSHRDAEPQHSHGLLTTLRSVLRLANRVAEETYRHVLTARFTSKGYIVLFDRHFLFDYYSTDILAPRTFAQKAHGLFLRHIYPRPNLVIYLDAPPEVWFARKGEGTLDSLARNRDEYLSFGGLVPRFHVVDGTQPLDRVVADVAEHIEAFAVLATSR